MNRARSRLVLAPEVGAEAVRVAVGDLDGLVEAVDGEQRRHRAEDLLEVEVHLRRDAGQQRRLVEPAGPVDPLAPDEDGRALADGVLHVLLHVLAPGLRGQRARSGCPRPSGRRPSARAIFSANSRVNSSATSACTKNRLAAMQLCPLFWLRAVTATSAAFSRSADGMTMNGSLPPSSSTVGFSTSPAIEATDCPAGRAAGEGRGDHPVVAQHLLDGRRADQQRLEHVGREARLAEQLLDVERGLGHVAGVLEQADVARHERRGGEPHRLPQREVPRHDRQDDAERLVHDVGLGRARPPRRPCARARASRGRARRTSAGPSRTWRPRPSPRRASCPSRWSSARRRSRCRRRARPPRPAASRRAPRGSVSR